MKKIAAGLAAAAATLGTPLIASAQFFGAGNNNVASQGQSIFDNLGSLLTPFQPAGDISIRSLFITAFTFIILLAGVIAILYLIWAGIQYITASTDEDKAKKAKTAIFNAIIGIVVIILSYAIIFYVARLTQDAAGSITGNGSTTNGAVLPGQVVR